MTCSKLLTLTDDYQKRAFLEALSLKQQALPPHIVSNSYHPLREIGTECAGVVGAWFTVSFRSHTTSRDNQFKIKVDQVDVTSRDRLQNLRCKMKKILG